MSKFLEEMFPIKIGVFLEHIQSAYDISSRLALSLLFRLMEAEMLKELEKTPRFYENRIGITVSAEDLQSFIERLLKREPSQVAIGHGEYTVPRVAEQEMLSLVTTLPSQLEDVEAPSTFESLRHAFRRLIQNTRDILRIASPYIDQPGLNCLIDTFEAAKKKDVQVRLLTRIDDRQNPNARQLTAIITLYDILGKNFSAREHSATITSGNRQVLWGGVHAKILSADSNFAYLGSGEIRDASLNRNFEMGFICKKESIVQAVNLYFDSVWGISAPITYEYCKSFIS